MAPLIEEIEPSRLVFPDVDGDGHISPDSDSTADSIVQESGDTSPNKIVQEEEIPVVQDEAPRRSYGGLSSGFLARGSSNSRSNSRRNEELNSTKNVSAVKCGSSTSSTGLSSRSPSAKPSAETSSSSSKRIEDFKSNYKMPAAELNTPLTPIDPRLLNRKRLEEIEQAACYVLMEQERLRQLEKTKNAEREALGVFRRKEITGKSCWIQTSDHQFVSYTLPEAKKKLEFEKVRTEKRVEESRSKLKANLRDLHELHPGASEMAPEVLNLLCAERDKERARKEGKEGKDGEKIMPPHLQTGGGMKELTGKQVVQNRLDYSRFDDLDTSSDEE